MRLTKLKIEHFRGITSMEIAFERNVTVLIGENNSGKTSVLEAIRFGLDSIKSNKSCVFSEFDFQRSSPESILAESPEILFAFSFEETEESRWNDDILRILDPVIVGDEFSAIKLRLKGRFDIEQGEMCQDWTFLEDSDNEMPGKSGSSKDIRRLRPFFFQSALRVAREEFKSGMYWNSFVKNKDIDDTLRKTLESELSEVNLKIIGAHGSFKDITEEVKRISTLVSMASDNAVSIDPVHADVYRALRYAEVNLLTEANARIPVNHHGEGTQSLSVLLLFSAYLKKRLQQEYDRLAEPIIAIEEPEAHLHPGAIRSVWSIINDLPGQKIIVTHSGDILSEVPIQSIRRLSTTSGSCTCHFIPDGALDPEELRKFNHHVRRNRGELLFARTWLLVEGETDVSVFVECAEILGINLHQHGVRVVECSQAGGPKLFVKAADALGIQWHVVADNDNAGQKYIDAAKALLDGRTEGDLITKLKSSNIDVLLCCSGYGEPYNKGIPSQQQQPFVGTWEEVLDEMKRTYPNKPGQALNVAKKLQDRAIARTEITADEGTIEYWEQVYKVLKNGFSKPAASLESIEIMRQKGSEGVPPQIVDIFKKIISQPGDN